MQHLKEECFLPAVWNTQHPVLEVVDHLIAAAVEDLPELPCIDTPDQHQITQTNISASSLIHKRFITELITLFLKTYCENYLVHITRKTQ
jgi:hypothetical protein